MTESSTNFALPQRSNKHNFNRVWVKNGRKVTLMNESNVDQKYISKLIEVGIRCSGKTHRDCVMVN